MKERPNERSHSTNFEFDALHAANNYRRALARMFAPHLRGRVIEVGAGIGQVTEIIRALPDIESLLSIEPEANFCREFRRTLPAQPLLEGTIDSLGDGQPADAILSVNVLEHIRDDEQELAAYHRQLRERRGKLCLFVPARPELYAPIDAFFGHHRRYTKPELRRKLVQAGFDVLCLNYFNCVGYFAWWLSFRVLKKTRMGGRSVHLYDRYIFPAVFALESKVCSPPFGQSLVAIAQAK
jgi:SAM-dependent methyltransferase